MENVGGEETAAVEAYEALLLAEGLNGFWWPCDDRANVCRKVWLASPHDSS